MIARLGMLLLRSNPARSVFPTAVYVTVKARRYGQRVAGNGGLISLPGTHDASRSEITDRVNNAGLSLVRNSLYDEDMLERIAP
jgi:hypothetical protein